MYESHFSLRELPFNRVLNTRFFFPSSNYQEVLSTLHIAVRTGEGFVKVIGETGVGKTILCRKFIAQLDDDCAVAYISHPCESPFQLLLTLAGEFAIPVQDRTDEHQLIVLLTKQFLGYLNANKRIILCFDDAQNISRECLETLRLLTNFGAENKRRPQVFLFGQPVLDAVLIHPSMQRVQQQIIFQCQLNGLRKSEIAPYLHHRLQVAGYRGKQIFSQAVIRWMYRQSGGVPQILNDIAHQSLLFVLREGAREVLPKHVTQSLPESKDIYGSWLANVREHFLPLLQLRAWIYASFILLLTGSIWLSAGLSTGTIAAVVQLNTGQVIAAAPNDLAALNSDKVLLPAKGNDHGGVISKTKSLLERATKSPNSTQFIPARKPIKLFKQKNYIAKTDSPKQWAEREFKKVPVLIRNGHIAFAQEKCFKILNVYAQHDEARLTLVKLLLKEGQLSEAESILIEGIQLSMGQAVFANILSQIQLKRGDIEVAVNTLQYSLPKAIGQADYHARFGSLLQSQSRHGEAIKHYQTAINLSPETGQWLFALGVSLHQEGYLSEANEMFTRAQKSQDLDKDILAFIDRRVGRASH